MLLPGVGNLAGTELVEPANAHANEHLHPHGYIYERPPNRNRSASDRHNHSNGKRDALFHAIADLYALPDANPYPDSDAHGGAADADVHRNTATAAVEYPGAAYGDPYGRAGGSERHPQYPMKSLSTLGDPRQFLCGSPFAEG